MICPEDTGLSKDSNSSEGPNGENNKAPFLGTESMKAVSP